MSATAAVPEPDDHRVHETGRDARTPESFPVPALERGQLLFRTLGTAEIHVGGSTVISPGSERMFSLLCVCAMTPEQAVARARLLELVWPELDGASGRHSLRQHLYRLRQLGIEIDGTRAAIRLDRSCLVPSFSLDRTAALFDRDVLRGSEPFGHLFAGWLPAQPSMRRWVERQREQYHADVRRILVPELRRLRDRGDWEECERWARTVLEFDPFNEDATVIVAEAVAMLGSRIDASSLLDEYVRETGAKGTDLGRRVERTQQRIQRASRLLHGESATGTLIGRERELATLDTLTLAAMRGESQVVHLIGPAGIGKTELGYEATRRAVILGFARCVVRVSRPVGQVTHGTLSRLTRDLINLPGSLGCKPENLRLLRQFAGLEVGVGDQERTSASLVECLVDLVSAVSDEQPLFVLLDDLHYVDRHSIEDLERLFDLIQKVRVLIVTTSRDDSGVIYERVSDDGRNTLVRLAGLSFAEGSSLAASVRTASGRSLDALSAQAVARASGSTPLAIVTLAREQLLDGLTNHSIKSLRETLTSQLTRLSDESRTLAAVLAVLGGRAHVQEVDAILQMPLTERTRALRVLIDSGLVAESASNEIICHDEVQETVLDILRRSELLQVRRQAAITLLERVRRQFSPERAITLLSLAEKSEDVEIFVDAVTDLAPRLAGAGLWRGALGFLERASELAPDGTRRAAVLEKLVYVANLAAEWRTVRTSANQLRALSDGNEKLSPRIALAEIEAALQSDLDPDSRIHAVRALALAKTQGLEDAERNKALRLVITAASDLFQADLAVSAFAELQTCIAGDHQLGVAAAEPRMQYHTIFGDLDAAVSIALRIYEDRASIALSAEAVRLLNNASFVFRVAGEFDYSRQCMEFALTLPSIEQSDPQKAMVFWRLSLIELDSGQMQAAISWSDALFQLTDGGGQNQEYAWSRLHRLRIEYLKSGRLNDASVAHRYTLHDRVSPSRLDVYCTALALHAESQSSGADALHGLLDRAVRFLAEYGRYTGMDFLATSIAQVAQRRGVLSSVRSLIWRYFESDRRERSKLPAHFLSLDEEVRDLVVRAVRSRIDR